MTKSHNFTEWFDELKENINEIKKIIRERKYFNVSSEILSFLFEYCGGEKRITKKALKYVEENKDKLRDMYYNSKLKSLLDNVVELE